MRKIKLKTILIAIITMLTWLPQPALAQELPGDLVVEYEDAPLFNELDVKPCDVYTKSVTVTNNSNDATYQFGIATFDELDPEGFGGVLDVRIYDEDGNDLYGGSLNPKTLADLFEETEYSDNPSTPGTEVLLLLLAPGETATINMEVSLACDIGNEWQAKSVEFSFGTGWTGSVLGEEKKEETVEVLGVELSKTGQNILIWLAIGTMLIIGSRKFKNKKINLINLIFQFKSK